MALQLTPVGEAEDGGMGVSKAWAWQKSPVLTFKYLLKAGLPQASWDLYLHPTGHMHPKISMNGV